MKMTMAESGRLGGLAARHYWKKKYLENLEKYNKDPYVCKFCGKIIEYKDRVKKFCNQSCAAKYNNRGINRHWGRTKRSEYVPIKLKSIQTKIQKKCLFCGKDTYSYKYCSLQCQADYDWKIKKERFEKDGFFSGCNNDTSIRKHFKRYILEKRGHRCEICNNSEWMGKEIPLIIDHIDGHSENNDLNNLRLVCGNCDMQLPTYKSKNKGNGRTYRRKRYADGKSY